MAGVGGIGSVGASTSYAAVGRSGVVSPLQPDQNILRILSSQTGQQDSAATSTGSGQALGSDGTKNLGNGTAANGEPLTDDQQQQITELRHRDTVVRAHEAAHMAVGGAYVRGGASYSFEQGPDGRAYAVGGEVSIDASPEEKPESTIQKMQIVQAAAMAPAQPSGQDFAVAAAAAAQMTQAEMQKAREASDASEGESADGSATAGKSAAGEKKNSSETTGMEDAGQNSGGVGAGELGAPLVEPSVLAAAYAEPSPEHLFDRAT